MCENDFGKYLVNFIFTYIEEMFKKMIDISHRKLKFYKKTLRLKRLTVFILKLVKSLCQSPMVSYVSIKQSLKQLKFIQNIHTKKYTQKYCR